ncbi:MAG: hypothetical protein K0U10_06700 [Gammaproteobacteria bacterium]|nr:hypothetical protein [Gammaproteobacteria bacterium]
MNYLFSKKENKCVLIESPYKSSNSNALAGNVAYAKECVSDALKRGEYPFASHLLYNIPEERELGIKAGLEWGKHASKTIVYIDRGLSDGMKHGIENAIEQNREIIVRSLYKSTGEGFKHDIIKNIQIMGGNVIL